MLGKLRKDRGLTQTQLGNSIGVSKSTISGWENNRNIMELGYAKAFADFFDVKIEDLYEWITVNDFPVRRRKRKGK